MGHRDSGGDPTYEGSAWRNVGELARQSVFMCFYTVVYFSAGHEVIEVNVMYRSLDMLLLQ